MNVLNMLSRKAYMARMHATRLFIQATRLLFLYELSPNRKC